MADVAAPQNKKSGARRWAVGCAAVFSAVALLGCCGCVVGPMLFPALFVSLFLDDAPLPGPTTAPNPVAVLASRARACAELTATGETRFSPEEVAQWVVGEGAAPLSVLRIGAQGDMASLALSISNGEEPPRWVNIQTKAAFTLENGWFTDFRMDQVEISTYDLTDAVFHQEMAQQINQSMANQRSQDPELAALLDSTTLIKVEDGGLTLKLKAGGVAMQKICAPVL